MPVQVNNEVTTSCNNKNLFNVIQRTLVKLQFFFQPCKLLKVFLRGCRHNRINNIYQPIIMYVQVQRIPRLTEILSYGLPTVII